MVDDDDDDDDDDGIKKVVDVYIYTVLYSIHLQIHGVHFALLNRFILNDESRSGCCPVMTLRSQRNSWSGHLRGHGNDMEEKI